MGCCFLDVPQRHASVEGGGDERVPQQIRRHCPVDPGVSCQAFDNTGGGIPVEASAAVVVQEDRSLLAFADTGRWRIGLHAKLNIIDRQRVFLGSINLDSRSLLVATEMGVLIDNVALAEQATAVVAELMAPVNSWRVEIGPDRHLRWNSDTDTLDRQPAGNPSQRLSDMILGHLRYETTSSSGERNASDDNPSNPPISKPPCFKRVFANTSNRSGVPDAATCQPWP